MSRTDAAAAAAGPGSAGLAPLAPVFGWSKGRFLAASGRRDALAQPGAVVLPEPFVLPPATAADPVGPREGEACLETFVVQPDPGADPDAADRAVLTIEPTGVDPAVAAWWRPAVERLVDVVVAAVVDAGVELAYPAYVTASTTPLEAVAGGPHLDDDQTEVGSGVGLVAVAGSHLGPRVVRGAVGCRGLDPPAPVEVAAEALDAFDDEHDGDGPSGDGPTGVEPAGGGRSAIVEEFPADRVVVFTRFGQLHAGPRFADGSEGIRRMLVFRADTVPATDGARAPDQAGRGRRRQRRRGSGPT